MEQISTTPKKKKKVSRKDLASLSMWETLMVATEVYGKLSKYLQKYRWRFILGLIFQVLAGASNAIFIFGFNFIFAVVLAPPSGDAVRTTTFTVPFVNRTIDILSYVPEGFRNSVTSVTLACILVPVLFLIRGSLTYIANYLMAWVGTRVLYDLRKDTYGSLMKQSIGYFSQAKTGALIQVVFNQCRIAQTSLVTLSQDVIQRPVAILSILAVLFYLNWEFTFYSLVVFPLCILPVIAVSKKIRKAGTMEEAEAGAMMVHMSEAFSGIRVVKSHAREPYEEERFDRSNLRTKNMIMRFTKAKEIVGMLVETIASCGVAIGLYYAWRSNITPTDFLTLVGGLTQIYPHAKALSQTQILLQKTIVAASSVFQTMEEEPDVADADNAIVLPRVQGRITFKDVSFTYPTNRKIGKAAVENVNLEMEPGKFYALVGPSGAGKSSLFSLLQRFYDVDEGSILVDGVDIREVTQRSLRENLGVVNQDVFLFHDNILENIRYGRLESRKEDVVAAAKKAHADDFIQEQENKYETIIGEKGCRLSGGQQQRLSIARAILRNAPILLLDEATSALDTESEKIIKEAIHNLSEGKTVIAIAHRLSTIMEADRIVVMEKGQVLDVGNHSELLERCDLYKRLYHLQFEDGEADGDVAVPEVNLDALPPTLEVKPA